MNTEFRIGERSALDRLRITRFDLTVWIVVAALLAITLLTVLIGDRVGARVMSAAPIGTAHSTNPIYIQFNEDMNQSSVQANLLIDPPLEGDFRWNGRTMIFQPATALLPGTEYTVSLPKLPRPQYLRRPLASASL